jgi:uncharacterized protein GlcG (DUF336 family)
MNDRCLVTFVMVMMLVCLSGTVAFGQDIRQEKNISLTLAMDAARGAVQFCREKGWNVAVAVVDRSGQIIVQLRADGAGPHTIDASRRKAFTSASARNNTSAILENVQKNPGAANLPMIDSFLVLGGGVPIRVGNEVIGAIGVGGAPGGHLDDQCAEAGINAIRDRLK